MRVNVDRSLRVVVISGTDGNGSYEVLLTHNQAMVASRLIRVHAEMIQPDKPIEGKRYEPITR